MCCGLGGNCCGIENPLYNYKYKPSGKIDFHNVDTKYSNIKYTVKGPFRINLEFEMEKVYTYNFSIIPTAMACEYSEPYPLNFSNVEKLSLSIDKSFVYKNIDFPKHTNLLKVDDHYFFYIDYRNNPNTIYFDEKFLYYAKFSKGWTNFTVSGELQDGQKFKFEKNVYLDL